MSFLADGRAAPATAPAGRRLGTPGAVCQPAAATVPRVHPENLIETFGTIGLFLIVFAESGLFFGFFLPGDSLLFTAGLLASQGHLNFPVILVGCFLSAVAGDQVGYAFGSKVGPALFRRPDSRLFRKSHLNKAQLYFDKAGPKTIVLARFIPFVRTFAPIVAGVANMQYRTFVTYNVVGGLLWAVGVTTLGYVLGETIPDIDKYLLPAVGIILVASLVPIGKELLRMKREGEAERAEQATAPAPEGDAV